uniref:SusF first starch specific CBM domain-containing protein n=1 Tax=uncultured Muribaculaceae bacterium TaxID=2301481 RepID=A0A6G8F3H0_9BACT|nr:hypothetical protein Muribac1_0490 [uncultured Muribaculaceae bacterium]
MASSCEETIDPALPQQNPQQPIVNVEDIATAKAGVLASDAVINLENYNSDGTTVPVIKLEKADSLPEGAKVSYKLEISPNDDFSRSVTLDTQSGDGESADIYSVSAQAWNDAHVSLFGKSPKEKTAYYRVPVYIDLDGSNYRLNGNDYYAVSGSLKETCFDLGFVIEDHYYLLGNATTWDMAKAKDFAFEHDTDVSVYDNPVFKIKLEVTQDQLDANGGGSYWKIAPESSVDAQNWDALLGTEVNGDSSLEGHLVGPGKVESGMLTVPGKYELSINMEEMTYSFELLLQPDVLYTPGDTNGWNQLASAWLGLSKEAYYGVSPLSTNGFKICADSKWDNSTDYGAENSDPALSGKLVLGQAGANINCGENGLYWIKVDYDKTSYQMTEYTLTKITRVGVIGSFKASSWGDDVEMTSTDDGKTWTANISFAAGDEFKIRFNNGWDMNLGGSMDGLLFDQGNVKVETAGDYVMTLSLLGSLPKVTLTAK